MGMNRFACFGRPLAALVALCTIAALAAPARADPPSRALRVSYVAGSASFSPAGRGEWLQARVNRPLWVGDRLWSGDGRVELQIGGASLRLAPRTLVRILNFDDRLVQFELPEGSVALHVRTIDRDAAIEIDTPVFAFVAREEGDYRIDVARDRTAVGVRRGFADVHGSTVAYRIDRREQFVFFDASLTDYDVGPLPRPDPFDRWVRERTQREDASVSARYVNPDLVGFVDLDAHGEWRVDATYGNVWLPRVAADWAPYRNGHWTWIDPWGWTWIDDAPWGYASTHYGRWARLGERWAWVPGPRNVSPVYSPALVAWVGGDGFSLSLASGRTRGIAWFPLAPGEVWRPPYEVSREYFTRVNVANTTVNQTTVVNVYESRGRAQDVRYRYREAPAAITAVPMETVVRGRPVQQNAVHVTNNVMVNAPIVAASPAQPTAQSFAGPAPASQARPPAESINRPIVARTAPAAVAAPQDRGATVQGAGRAGDRSAPSVQGAPAPGSTHPLPPSQPQAGQATAGRVAPSELRSNVRVIEGEQATPKPPPPENARAPRGGAVGDERRERAAPPGQSPQAAPLPQAPQPQAAEPPRMARPPQASQPQAPSRDRVPPEAQRPQPPQDAARPMPAQPVAPQPERPRSPSAVQPQRPPPQEAARSMPAQPVSPQPERPPSPSAVQSQRPPPASQLRDRGAPVAEPQSDKRRAPTDPSPQAKPANVAPSAPAAARGNAETPGAAPPKPPGDRPPKGEGRREGQDAEDARGKGTGKDSGKDRDEKNK